MAVQQFQDTVPPVGTPPTPSAVGLHLWEVDLNSANDVRLWVTTPEPDIVEAARRAKAAVEADYASLMITGLEYHGTIDA